MFIQPPPAHFATVTWVQKPTKFIADADSLAPQFCVNPIQLSKGSEEFLGGRQIVNAATMSLAASAASLTFAEPKPAAEQNFSIAAPTAEAA